MACLSSSSPRSRVSVRLTDAPRILIAKPGLDGHDRGARMIVRLLEEAGFDVRYTGIRKTPGEIARQAGDQDVDAIGLSILSGAHMELVPQVITALQQAGLEHLPLAVGGIIPPQDRTALLEMGVVAVFGPGARSDEIIPTLRQAAEAGRRARGRG